MIDLGYSSLFAGLLAFLLSSVLFFIGIRRKDVKFFESGKRAVTVGSLFVIISSLSLLYLLITQNFRVEYVASYTSMTLPLLYKIAAFWAGMEGSMLFWVLILSVYFIIYIFNAKTENIHRVISYFVISLVALFFLFVTFFLTNPFKTLPFTPPDGKGLNPLLQNYWMLIHPVTLYLGYVGFTIPFGYAAAILIKGERKGWTEEIRRWTLISWLFLSIGIVFGGRWAYVELGWGGYWAWDPVENASFLPWLTATAFVHTLLIQETKKTLKMWNLALIVITFILVVTGTYITRSGALSSVHAFAESRLGPYFGSLVLLTFIFLIFSLIKFRKNLKEKGEKFSLFGLEGLILFLLFSLIAITVATLIGTFYPIITGVITGQKITVGPEFFVKATGPFFIIVLILMGIYPFTYRNTSKIALILSILAFVITSLVVFIIISKHPGAFLSYGAAAFAFVSNIYLYIRHLKKYKETGSKNLLLKKTGSFLIHFGIILTAIGIVSSYGFKVEKEFTLKRGDIVNFEGYEIEYEGLTQDFAQNYDAVTGEFIIKNGGKIVGKLVPSLRFYHNWEQPSAEMDVFPLWHGDIYGVIQGWEKDGTVYIQLFYNPLIQLVWFGTILLFIGGLIVIITKQRN